MSSSTPSSDVKYPPNVANQRGLSQVNLFSCPNTTIYLPCLWHWPYIWLNKHLDFDKIWSFLFPLSDWPRGWQTVRAETEQENCQNLHGHPLHVLCQVHHDWNNYKILPFHQVQNLWTQFPIPASAQYFSPYITSSCGRTPTLKQLFIKLRLA